MVNVEDQLELVHKALAATPAHADAVGAVLLLELLPVPAVAGTCLA